MSATLILATLTGTQYTIDFDTTKTVGEFKKVISKKINIIPERQKIIFSGQELKDEETLDTYKVQEQTILHLLIIDEKEYWEEHFNKMIETQGKKIDDKMKNVALLNKKIRQVLKEHIKLLTTDTDKKSNKNLNEASNKKSNEWSCLCIRK